MAAAPGFRHDIFVSYAHADNIPTAGAEVGFVSRLVSDLRIVVTQKVGNDVDIWWDHYKLAGNVSVTPEIMGAAAGCACVVAVISPAYLKSEWCSRERGAFLELIERRQTGRAGAIFMVSIEQIDQSKLPSGFRDLTGYPFYRPLDSGRATRPLRTDLAQDKQPYYDLLSELAQNISNYLEKLKENKVGRSTVSIDPANGQNDDRTSVFLTEVTDDLVQRRTEIKNYLEQAGILVLPEKRYSRDDMALHRKQILADLERSRACVQIVGPLSGDRSDHPRGMAWLRYETIRDSGTQVPFIQWRDPDISLNSVTDADARELLRPASVRTDRLPQFRRWVAELALKKPDRAAPNMEQGVVSIFINSDLLDRPFGSELAQWFERNGFMVLEPPEASGDAREEWETNLKYCDTLMLVYGKTKPNWVKTQLLLSNKIPRDAPFKKVCVYLAPPAATARDKVQELALRYSGIHYIHNEQFPELNQRELEDFVNRLRGPNA
jgi:hypothetical protein